MPGREIRIWAHFRGETEADPPPSMVLQSAAEKDGLEDLELPAQSELGSSV